MGNYHNIEREFIERTMKLLAQYEDILPNYPFEEQYNYTLTINCLLGLIVMPKARIISHISTVRLTRDFRMEMGLEHSQIADNIRTLRELIQRLRNAIAHFDIEVISEDDRNLVDWIKFKDGQNDGALIAEFRASEIVPFLRYYSKYLIDNMDQYRTQTVT